MTSEDGSPEPMDVFYDDKTRTTFVVLKGGQIDHVESLVRDHVCVRADGEGVTTLAFSEMTPDQTIEMINEALRRYDDLVRELDQLD